MDVTPQGTGGLDVSPRPQPTAVRRKRKLPAVVFGIVVLAGIVFVLTRALGDAAVFFLNADEAVARRDELGDDRFRLQGNVVPGSTQRSADGVSFEVAFNGVRVAVNHVGDPPDLFQDCIPVVLEGRFRPDTEPAVFASTLMLVKHDETYDATNPDRIVQSSADKCGGIERPSTGESSSAP